MDSLMIRLGSGADRVSVHPRAASTWTFVECPGGKSFFDNLNSASRHHEIIGFVLASPRESRARDPPLGTSPSDQDWVRFVKRLGPNLGALQKRRFESPREAPGRDPSPGAIPISQDWVRFAKR